MKILFIHQNLPGQYKHVLQDAVQRGHQVVAIGEKENMASRTYPPQATVIRYDKPAGATPKIHHYLPPFEAAIRRGQAVFRICQKLREGGFHPDLICCHPGWGEALFLKDVFPRARLCCYFEFFYHASNSDVDFNPASPASVDDRLRIRIKNTTQLHALESADLGISPTLWQKSRYPRHWHDKIQVLHEGVDTDALQPRQGASFALPNGAVLQQARDEVITFVNRNLEPYRGFDIFMHSLPDLLQQRPRAQVVIVGRDGVSYGKTPPPPHLHWREKLTAELGDRVDWQRVHFTGKIPYVQYQNLLQVSSLHVYLTYPFVLSWSMLEAMSSGCLILASATAPVQEVIRDGENGFLTPFFDAKALADKAAALLSQPRTAFIAQRNGARQTIVERYDLKTAILPAFRQLLGY